MLWLHLRRKLFACRQTSVCVIEASRWICSIRGHNFLYKQFVSCVLITKNMYSTSSKFSSKSSLYISHLDEQNAAVVNVDLDLVHTLENIDTLASNLKRRGLGLNVHLLHLMHKQYLKKKIQKDALEKEREEIAGEMKEIVLSKILDDSRKQALIKRGKDVRQRLKDLQLNFYALEEEVTLDALKLPTNLHSSTHRTAEIIEEFGMIPKMSWTPKSHVHIGQQLKTLSFSPVAPGAYYLHGDLANMKRNLQIEITQCLLTAGLSPLQGPDIVKAVVMEAAGEAYNDPLQTLILAPKFSKSSNDRGVGNSEEATTNPGTWVVQQQKWDTTMYLCGVSPMTFLAYFTRTFLPTSSLPRRYFCVGTKYTANIYQEQRESIVTAPHPVVAEVFGIAADAVDMEYIYHQYVDIMKCFGQWSGLKIRLVRVPCHKLLQQEAARTNMEVWLLSDSKYVQLGHVSMWNDFASRRLMIRHGASDSHTTKGFTFTVHGTLLHIPTLLAAFMEYSQDMRGQCTFDFPLQHMPKSD